QRVGLALLLGSGSRRRGLLRLGRLRGLAVYDDGWLSVVGNGRGVGVLDLAHQVADGVRRGPALGQGRAVGDGLDRQTRQGRLHEAAPDGGGRRAAGDAGHRLVVVLADPDGGDEAARVADEPGVLVVRGGAGLARDVAPADGGRTTAGRGDQPAQHLV